MRSIFLIAGFAIASFAAGLAHAGSARDQLEAFTKGLDSLSGNFVQESKSSNGAKGETTRGTLALRAPRQFRWEYAAPYPQTIVADGDNVWIHDIDLEQVTVRQQASEEARSPLTVLIDFSQLDRDYTVAEGKAKDGLLTLLLKPRYQDESGSLEDCTIAFDSRGPARMEVRDGLGQLTIWRFSGWQRNPKLDDKLFAFTPPPGTDVIGEAVPRPNTQPLRD